MDEVIRFAPFIIEGLWVTILVSIVSLLISTIIGIFSALAKLSGRKALALPFTFYTTIIRGIPDLILMLFIYYGGQIALNNLMEFLYENGFEEILDSMGYEGFIPIEPFTAGCLTIGFIFGAYMSETFRGAILSVKKGQIEAGIAFGMPSVMLFRRITFPQMMRHALPGFINNWMVLVKSTALVSIIGLSDMVRNSKQAADSTRMPFTFYLVTALLYLLITTVSLYFLNKAEKKFRIIE